MSGTWPAPLAPLEAETEFDDLLSTAGRVLLAGDMHGNVPAFTNAADQAVQAGCRVLLQVGDFGIGPFDEDFRWGTRHFGGQYDQITAAADAILGSRGLIMLVVPGNHDNYDRIDAEPLDTRGRQHFSAYWRTLPRGHRFEVGGRRFGAVGGAHSIDRDYREPHVSWWEAERITQDDIDTLGDEPLDVLLTHDVPEGTPVQSHLRLPDIHEQLSRDGRLLLAQAARRTQPRLVFSGHWHQRVSGAINGGRTRVEVLNMEREPGSTAVLDLSDLTVS